MAKLKLSDVQLNDEQVSALFEVIHLGHKAFKLLDSPPLYINFLHIASLMINSCAGAVISIYDKEEFPHEEFKQATKKLACIINK